MELIQVTESAASQIKTIQKADNKEGWGLRVSVVGGGCSGMSYKLDFEQEAKAEDKVQEVSDVRVFIDSKSALFIKGMTLDFTGGLNGAGFHFKNPNATATCGCGTSFAV